MLFNGNIEKIILFGLLIAVLILSIFALVPLFGNKNQNIRKSSSNFQTLMDSKNNVEFQVTPISLNEFEISMNTHSVDLDFDLIQIANLYDDIGNAYKPINWEGSAPGGHHREGILKFPLVNKNAKSIKLIITDSSEREFVWNLN